MINRRLTTKVLPAVAALVAVMAVSLVASGLRIDDAARRALGQSLPQAQAAPE